MGAYNLIPYQPNQITIGPLIDVYGSYITVGTIQAMIMDSEGLIWDGTSWQAGTYWFNLNPTSNPGFWSFTWTPNKADVFWILYYIQSPNWTGYMLEQYIAATLFIYDQFTSLKPKLCFIRLLNISGEPMQGKVIAINLDGVKRDVNGEIIYNLPQKCATDEQGYAFFYLLPQDQIFGSSQYILTIDNTSYSFTISSNDTEPVDLGGKLS